MSTLSAIEIAALVRAGTRTPLETVEASLVRIAARDTGIGAFQLVDADGARRAAEALAGRPDLAELPLAGVPVAIKDNIDVSGHPTRHGSGATSTEPAAEDDLLVRRLREAGAVVVGKTRLPELAIWGFTESAAHGGTRNPRNPARNAGGSTGGGAAAVAAGMVPLALGSDGGGSLRIPPANCGVVGFKPARGTVPLAGGLEEHWYGCSEYGPVAATVADAILALDVLAADPSWRAKSGSTGPLRVAVSLRSPSPIGPAGRAARAAVRRAGSWAAGAGHTVTRSSPPYPRTLANIWVSRWLAGVAEEVERLGLDPDRLEPRTRSMVVRGRRLRQAGRPEPAPAQAWRQAALHWFSDVDVLVTPVIAHPAPPYGWGDRAGYWRAYVNGARTTPFTQAWNVAGFPAMSLPLGGTATEPASVQLVTAPGREDRLLRLAAELERLSTSETSHVDGGVG
jgi:amidase